MLKDMLSNVSASGRAALTRNSRGIVTSIFWFWKKFKTWVQNCVTWPADSGLEAHVSKLVKSAHRDFREVCGHDKLG